MNLIGRRHFSDVKKWFGLNAFNDIARSNHIYFSHQDAISGLVFPYCLISKRICSGSVQT